MNRHQRLLSRAVFGAAMLSLGTLAHAEMLKFHAHLLAATEVPPKGGAGKGEVEVTLDTATNEMVYTATYTGLSGPATMAHFHGPALAGSNAGVIIPVKGSVASPIKGEAMLTPEQASDMVAGKWYFNVHTAANPGGEIRGQVEH